MKEYIEMEQNPKDTETSPEASESCDTKTEKQIVEGEAASTSNIEAELDITSRYFNPLKALYAPDYRVTEKQPKIIYQNMAAFETALKKVGIMGLNKKHNDPQPSGSKNVKSKNALMVKEKKPERRFQAHQMAIKTKPTVKSKHKRNLLMQMSQSEGPLKKLREYIAERRSIKVIIRREHGIKGYVKGVLVMFDRHWNLLLVNVVESLEYRKYKYAEDRLIIHQMPQDCSDKLQKLGIVLPTQHVKSLGRKRVEITRHLPQILVRGEHVVLISAKEPI